MSYGFKIYDANGNLEVSSDDMGYWWVDTIYLANVADGSQAYPEYDGREFRVWFVRRTSMVNKYAYTVTVNGYTVYWTRDDNNTVSLTGWIMIFIK